MQEEARKYVTGVDQRNRKWIDEADLNALISQVVQNTLRHILIHEQWVSFSEHDKGMAVPSETVQSLLKEITSTTKEE